MSDSLSFTRRQLLLGAAGTAPMLARTSGTDIRIRAMDIAYEDFGYRVPIKFGGRAVDRATLLNVNCVVEGVGAT